MKQSFLICRRVWERGPSNPTQRYLLLAIADHADDSGYAFPGLLRLAERCVLGKRTVISALNQLEKNGWLKRIKNGRKSEYQVALAKLGIGADIAPVADSKRALSAPVNGAVDAPIGPSKGADCGAEKVQSTAAIGANYCDPPTPPYRRTTKEPLVESQLLRYRAAREAGKFTIHGWSDANFVAGGHWRDEQCWPWKPEFRPERKIRYCDPARLYDGPEYQPALARSHVAAESGVFSPLKSPQISQTQKASI